MPHIPRRAQSSSPCHTLLRLTAACVSISALIALPSKAQEVHARSLVTSAQIVAAMQARQLPTRGIQIRVAVPITSAAKNSALEIQATVPLNSHDVRLRMACQDPSECLPFFALASYADAIDPAAFQTKTIDKPSSSSQPLPATKLGVQAPVTPSSSKATTSGGPPVVRSGSPATLDFDEDHVHVRVEVICLENGAAGDKIRVTTRDRKQFYVAEVVSPNALKGTLTR